MTTLCNSPEQYSPENEKQLILLTMAYKGQSQQHKPRPGQTQAKFQSNILQHCCRRRIAHFGPPCGIRCSNMLQHVGWCWVKFKNFQIFVATFLDVARCGARLYSSFKTSYTCCIKMCRAFDLWTVLNFTMPLSKSGKHY